jgi:hypothetical protein
MKMKMSALLAILALLSGCASGVLQLSQNTYMISKTSKAGAFASRAGMQAKAIREANAFAAKQGKVAVATGTEWDRPTTGFPTFTYQFMLVDPSDPRAKDQVLEHVADTVIEDRR